MASVDDLPDRYRDPRRLAAGGMATVYRAEDTLLGRPVEVCYRIRGNGSGVVAVALNGAAVPFTRRANPHRLGAAVVTHAELESRLSSSSNVLEIEIG